MSWSPHCSLLTNKNVFFLLSTATIHVNEKGNNPPTAFDDTVSTDEDTPVTIDVLVNNTSIGLDFDPDAGDTLTVVNAAADPSHGGVILNSDGTFEYTPESDFFGQDSFVYTISDGNGGIATATGE